MQFLEPTVQLVNEKDNFKRIEAASRICYKSESKITNDSAYPFFQRMCKSGHTSTLEHSVIFVRTHNPETYLWLVNVLNAYTSDTGRPHYIRFSKWDENDDFYTPNDKVTGIPLGFCMGDEYLFSGNIRAWRNLCGRYKGEEILYSVFHNHPAFIDVFKDALSHDDLEFSNKDIEIVDSIPTDPNEYKYADMHNIVTLKIVGDRGVIDEFARHRQFGISVESTRFVSYAGNGVTFCFPFWFNKIHDDPSYSSIGGLFGNICYDAEKAYMDMIDKIKIPQIARGALPLWVKSEIAMTGTVNMWKDFIALRDSAGAHPEAQKIAKMIENVLVNEAGVQDYWGVKK